MTARCRAHSVAAQGGINAARSVAVDGDSVSRLFADTLKGGDFRAREAGCQRLAEISSGIIDQCVAQGVPFAREYGGSLATRRLGPVSRTFYARGQTGQQPLWRLSSHDAAGGARSYSPSYSPGCTGTHHRGWRRARCRSASPTGWRARDLHGEHGGALYRRVQQRLLSLDKCAQIQCECDLARSLQGCFLCQSLFHTDPSHLYSQWRCSKAN